MVLSVFARTEGVQHYIEIVGLAGFEDYFRSRAHPSSNGHYGGTQGADGHE